MRPKTITVTGDALTDEYSPVIPVDWRKPDFKLSIGVVLIGAAAGTYTVQHTFDDITADDFDATTASWFEHPSLVSLNASQDGHYAYPPRAIRLKVDAGASGDFEMTYIHAG